MGAFSKRLAVLGLHTALTVALLPSAHADDAKARGKQLLLAQAGFQKARLGSQVLGTYMNQLYLGFVESTVQETQVGGARAYAVTNRAHMKLGTKLDNRLEWQAVISTDLRPVTSNGVESTAGEGKPSIATTATLRRVKGGWEHASQAVTKGAQPELKKRTIAEQTVILSPIELTFPTVLLALTPGQPVEVPALHGKSGDIRWETWTRLPNQKRTLPAGEVELVAVQIKRPNSESKVRQSTVFLHPKTGKVMEMAPDGSPVSFFAIEAGQKGQNLK